MFFYTLIFISIAAAANGQIPYSFDNPDKVDKLPKKLSEISGLSYVSPGILACINDEKGSIYTFNIEDGDLEEKYAFGKSGDYEGIEIIDETAYILRSDGTLFKVKNPFLPDAKTSKIKTPLGEKNDAEGLAYYPAKKWLLIACKKRAGIEEKMKGTRSIYVYNLKKKKLKNKPWISISLEELGKKRHYSGFEPSGIAVHPITNDLYVIAAAGQALIILDKKGKIKYFVKLPRKVYRQPEGICFAPDGTLFISNEGAGGKATILTFKYRDQ